MLRKLFILFVIIFVVFVCFVSYLVYGSHRAYMMQQQKIEAESEYYIHRLDSLHRLRN
nr:MAG TPA: Histo-aspartic protease-aspartic protease, HAP, Plasmepsin, Aspartic [Microviridae sp.]